LEDRIGGTLREEEGIEAECDSEQAEREREREREREICKETQRMASARMEKCPR